MDHIKGKIDTNSIPKGHQPHRSGAGYHAHKNTKRLKTRSNQIRNAMKD